MKRVTSVITLAFLFATSAVRADVRFLIDESLEQSRGSVHTYMLETDALIPSQWKSLLTQQCCIVSEVFGTNKVIVTASPELLGQFRSDIEELEALAESSGDVAGRVQSLSNYYRNAVAIDITPQASESISFTVTDSRINMVAINAVLMHFPQATMTTNQEGVKEIACMAINERQIRQLLAASAR
ncbi:hypothetical protein [Salinibius halmophilus]|uniref:hypothetical protein n=1 Tax=Salinibius halmophilus TaxID=1853216 RepID=UPI000E66241F|nr:hypothetical protein [Salinibius halmophilus]